MKQRRAFTATTLPKPSVRVSEYVTAADLSPLEGLPGDAPERPPGIRQWMLELSVGFIALVTAVASYIVLSGAGPVDPNDRNVGILLTINIVLALVLVGAIFWRLYNLSRTRGSGVAGAQLHVRMVMIFAAIAIIPTVLVALFSAVMLNLGINSWFSDRVRTAIENASSVAEAYVSEHKQSIQSDAYWPTSNAPALAMSSFSPTAMTTASRPSSDSTTTSIVSSW